MFLSHRHTLLLFPALFPGLATVVSLAEDLDALKLYLELERLRCDEKFDFKISVDPDVDADFLQVPPMLMQPFVENAIWHGLMSKEGPGHLLINITQADSTLTCTIADDGIGRKNPRSCRAKSATKHKSMGLRITADRIAMIQGENGTESPVKINDLVEPDGTTAGTEVIIKMPVIEN